MYKNQLQELAQRSCFNLPSYACVREGPDHAPRFKASVNFNGEIFEGPSNCTTLRQAEHAAAEVALTNLSNRVPSKSLAARVLDETGVYKNLLQETAHKAGLKLPVYTTVRSGPGHQPVFTCSVELAGLSFAGESAKTKKQAEKNAATAAWSALKQMPDLGSSSQQSKEMESNEEQEQVVVNRILSNLRPKEDGKPVRQKNQQQQLQQHQRRRVVLGAREGSSAPSLNSLRYNHKWRSLNPLPEPSSMYPPQQQRCFLAPPPPNASRILTPVPLFRDSAAASHHESSSSKDNTNALVHTSSRRVTQVQIHEGPPQLEEKQKDGEDKMNGRSAVKEKSMELDSYVAKPNPAYPQKTIYTRSFAPQNTSGFAARMMDQKSQQTQMNTRPFTDPSMTPAPMRNLPAIPMFTGGSFHAPGIAPAVHIRSVIPVCAAPPPTRLAVNTPSVHRKEEEEEVSGAASKLNRLQL